MTAEDIIAVATHIEKTGDTVRKTAKVFKVSKSTIYKNMTQELKDISLTLYKKVQEVLKKNKTERNIRGGNATREKFRRLRMEKNQTKSGDA